MAWRPADLGSGPAPFDASWTNPFCPLAPWDLRQGGRMHGHQSSLVSLLKGFLLDLLAEYYWMKDSPFGEATLRTWSSYETLDSSSKTVVLLTRCCRSAKALCDPEWVQWVLESGLAKEFYQWTAWTPIPSTRLRGKAMICDEFYYRSNRLHRAQTMLLVEWKIRSVSFSKFSGLRPHLPRRHLENSATEEGRIEGLASGGRWWELQRNHVHVPSCTYILYTYVYIIYIIIYIQHIYIW